MESKEKFGWEKCEKHVQGINSLWIFVLNSLFSNEHIPQFSGKIFDCREFQFHLSLFIFVRDCFDCLIRNETQLKIGRWLQTWASILFIRELHRIEKKKKITRTKSFECFQYQVNRSPNRIAGAHSVYICFGNQIGPRGKYFICEFFLTRNANFSYINLLEH